MPNDIIGLLVDFVCLSRLSGQHEVEDPCASDGGDSDYADGEPTSASPLQLHINVSFPLGDAELASMATGLNTPSISADSALTVERSSYTGTSTAVTVATDVSLKTR